ncbi:putative major facilitator superfamily transporter [Stipitochalara longipes BDJ]|nr:putative major facilitator superfamily transporter [Stipitochalara longipes BDJ]
MTHDVPASDEMGGVAHESSRDGGIAVTTQYSVFPRSQRRWITLIVGVAMMFSPLSANIYLPCLPLLQRDMNTSAQLINLTVTAYVVLQGIAPAFFGELSDKVGRRPVYIISFGIYVAANVGLALQNRYAALLVLRMLQSLGASATVAIGYGVVADIATPAERGRVLGPAMVATNLGPILGPVIGGPLADKVGWRWVFWFLTILGGSFLLTVLLFLPESCRSIVGNGSIPARGWNRHWMSYISGRPTRKSLGKEVVAVELEKGSRPLAKSVKAILPNPWKSLRFLFQKDTSLVLSISAMFYMTYYIIQASMPELLERIYGFDEMTIGLCYFAIGFGVVIGGYVNGKCMDFNYRFMAKTIGFKIDKVAGDDLRKFPIERARSRFVVVYVLLHTACLVGYGWSLHQKIHVAGPLILQFALGFLATSIVQTFNTLLVDIHRDTPSTAAGAGNIARCALAAGGVAVMQPLLDRLGDGVFFSVLGCASGVLGWLLVFAVRRYGMIWRVMRENEQILPDVELEEGTRGSGTGLDSGNLLKTESCKNKPLEVLLKAKLKE